MSGVIGWFLTKEPPTEKFAIRYVQAHLVSLFGLAPGMGLLHLLLPEAGEPGGADDRQE